MRPKNWKKQHPHWEKPLFLRKKGFFSITISTADKSNKASGVSLTSRRKMKMATAKKAAKKTAAKKSPAKKAAAKKPVAKKAPAKKVAAKKAPAKKAPAKKPVAKKAPAKKAVAKKAPAKKAAKKVAKKSPAKKRTPNAAFMKPLTPSAALAAVVGSTPLARTEVVSKLWTYIKKHALQDKVNKRNINADDKLKAVFGKTQVTMFELASLIGKHLS